jgi:hypothetical protein
MISSTNNSKNQSKRFAIMPMELLQRTDLTSLEVRMFGTIVMHARKESMCWLGVSKLAVFVGASRVGASRAIRRLLELNLISEVQNQGGKTKAFTSNDPVEWVATCNQPVTSKPENLSDSCNQPVTSTCNQPVTSHVTNRLHRSQSIRSKIYKKNIKKNNTPNCHFDPHPENPPEWLDLGAPMYEPDGSHDISIDYNDLFNSEGNDNTNSMEAAMKDDYIDDANALISPVSDFNEPECINAQLDPQTALVANGKREIEPISPMEVDCVSKPTKFRYLPEHEEIARQWAAFAIERMPTVKANVEAWANELRLIEAEIAKKRLGEMYRIEPINLLKAILHFVRTDEFWGEQAISPMGLRKVSRSNSMRKFENILTSMRNSKQFKQKKADLAFEKLKEEMLNCDQDPF